MKKRYYSKKNWALYHREYRARNRKKIRAYKRAYNKKWRKKYGYHNELLSKLGYPEKEKARRIATKAIRDSVLKPLKCRDCKSKNTQAHHPNYLKPLEVIWLCPPCHTAEHRNGLPYKPMRDQAKEDMRLLSEYKDRIREKQGIKEAKIKMMAKIKKARAIEFLKKRKVIIKRNNKIIALRIKGLGLETIARQYGVSRQRIQQIIDSK